MGLFKKKSVDHALKDLVESLSAALGSKLLSVLMYGSKASGEFQEDRSDVNIFFVLSDASEETRAKMSGPLGPWLKAGHPFPVFIQNSELSIYAGSLPIEFLDMQDHHKIIFGSDFLRGFQVDRTHLRAQCAQELSLKLLKLRQAMIVVYGKPKSLRELLIDSLPSVLTLYRAALRLEGDIPSGPKIVAAKELAKRAGADAECLERLWEVHMRRQTDNLEDLAGRYLDSLERVLVYIGRK